MTNETATTIGSSESLGSLRLGLSDRIIAWVYKWFMDRHLGTTDRMSPVFGQNGETLPFDLTEELGHLQKALPHVQVRKKNLEAIRFIDEWFAGPDDLGANVWDEFDKELEANRFTI